MKGPTVTARLRYIEMAALDVGIAASSISRIDTEFPLAVPPADARSLETVRQRAMHEIEDAITALPGMRRDLHRLHAGLAAVRYDDHVTVARLESFDPECRHCGTTFAASRSDARYCSPRCRQAAYRVRDGSGTEPAHP